MRHACEVRGAADASAAERLRARARRRRDQRTQI